MARPTLRTVPDTPPRAVLYLRQSVSRDDSISLELQEAAGRDYCDRHGYAVVAVEADPGLTGRTWKRPAVQRTIAMIEDGHADIIVLWKWSRLSRSRRDWAIAADKVDVAGGRIESATEAVDVSTATGRLARGVLTEFAAFESDRIGEVWKEVHRSRLADGRAPNGKPRFGYRWDAERKIHVPDPETGPVLVEAYRRSAAGESFYSLVRWLNGADVRTINNGQWSDRSLRRVLDAGFAAGLLTWDGIQYELSHDRLIDDALWNAYRDRRAERRRVSPRTTRSQYLLSGLVRCARCDRAMVANPHAGRRLSFRCATAKEQGPTACAGGYVAMQVVEAAVIEWLQEAADDVDAERRNAGLRDARRLDLAAERKRVEVKVARIDAAISALTIDRAERLVTPENYRTAVDKLTADRAQLVERMEDLGRQSRAASTGRAEQARALLDDWDERSVEGRRAALSRLVREVRVVTGVRGGVRGVKGGASSAVVDIVEA